MSRRRKPKTAAGREYDARLADVLQQHYRSGYLRSNFWRGAKGRYRGRRPMDCWICHAPEGSVANDLHHTTYRRLGHERLNDTVPLCRSCHNGVHAWHREHPDETLLRSTRRYRSWYYRTHPLEPAS